MEPPLTSRGKSGGMFPAPPVTGKHSLECLLFSHSEGTQDTGVWLLPIKLQRKEGLTGHCILCGANEVAAALGLDCMLGFMRAKETRGFSVDPIGTDGREIWPESTANA